jgi:hypothetical protein
MNSYPRYATYDKKNPTVLDQEFPTISPNFDYGDKLLYPKTDGVEKYFNDDAQSIRFGAARFCGFLYDTIAVEHSLVIPAVSSASYLPLRIPSSAIEDLFKVVTDEGHHATQSVIFLHSLATEFGVKSSVDTLLPPKFIRRVEAIKAELDDPADRRLCDVIAGIVTETRISVELGEFARDARLIEPVRSVCGSHQADERIHSSQFRALGTWIWNNVDERKQELVAALYAKIIIARSLPDVARFASYLSEVTDMAIGDTVSIVKDVYTPERLKQETLTAANPTLTFLEAIGVLKTNAFQRTHADYDWNSELGLTELDLRSSRAPDVAKH